MISAIVIGKMEYRAIQKQKVILLDTSVPLISNISNPDIIHNPKAYQKKDTKEPRSVKWMPNEIYEKGDEVKFENHIFRAKWWNQGDMPNSKNLKGVWECMSKPIEPQESMHPIQRAEFKVLGYFLESQAEYVEEIPYEKLTHLYYAFAIPKENGTIMPLTQPQIAKKIIRKSKENDVKVLLSVGGKYYDGHPLESVFELATASEEKCKRFATNIINIVNQYGFDGVDIDWEYPSVQEDSKRQYNKLIHYLNKGLKKRGKVFSITVSPGVSPYKEILWDAKGYDDSVFNKVDWINIAAYGDEAGYLSYNYAIESLSYWRKERGIRADQLVLGVNFYAIPHNVSYGEIVEIYEDAHKKDQIDNMYYNGIVTMQYKALLALKETRGVVIWDLMGDTKIKEKSLLNAIKEVVDNEKDKT